MILFDLELKNTTISKLKEIYLFIYLFIAFAHNFVKIREGEVESIISVR
jgi:hypothetical protein